MEKRKISNWEHILKMMVGNWFEFKEVRQRVNKYELRAAKVEIFTSAHHYNFDFEEIKTILYDWKPVEHNGVPALNIFEHAQFEGDLAISLSTRLIPIKSLDPENNINDGLIAEIYETQHRHKAINEKFTTVINKIMDEFDKASSPSVHLLKKAEIISQFSKDNVSQQLTELKSLAMLQKAIEMKNKATETDKPDEDKPKDEKPKD
jgi:hypothetical protein